MKQFKDNLEDIDAALVEGLSKHYKREEGAEGVRSQLDSLNKHYIEMVKWTNNRLKEITARLAQANVDIKVYA